jgi:hypothetical protein
MDRLAVSLTLAIGMCLQLTSTTARDTKKPSDQELGQLLAGRWIWRPTSKQFIDITFANDQTFKCELGFGDLGFMTSGTWKIEARVLEIITKRIRHGEEEANVEKRSSTWSILHGSKVLSVDNLTLRLFNRVVSRAELEFKKVK